MAVVVISAVNYDSYVTLADANTYLAARIGATAWNTSVDADLKGQALVSATRRIQRYLAPLLTTVPDPADDPAPSPLPDATSELANVLFSDASVQDASSSGSNTKRVKAGSAEVEFFRPTDQSATVLPKVVQDLLNQYLASVGALSVLPPPTVTGTDAESSFCDEDEFGHSDGLP